MSTTDKMEVFLKNYIVKLNDILDKIDPLVLSNVVDQMTLAFSRGNTVYVAGNGGSAATASHMQADFSFFVRYFTKFRPKIFALTDNVPMITAVGNDTSFENIFIEQLRGRFVAGDVLIVISASGNSMNLIRAVEYVNEKGGMSISFIGFLGGRLKDISKISLYTPNEKGDYGPIEDVHMILNHIIVNYLAKDEVFLSIPEN